jgi:hypothetical protein
VAAQSGDWVYLRLSQIDRQGLAVSPGSDLGKVVGAKGCPSQHVEGSHPLTHGSCRSQYQFLFWENGEDRSTEGVVGSG